MSNLFKRLILVIFLSALFAACVPIPSNTPPTTVKVLTANKVHYAELNQLVTYTDGVVIYLSDDGDFLVITGQPLVPPEDFGETDYIVVRWPTDNIAIGDVLTINSVVASQTVTVENKEVEVQYLDPYGYRNVEITGKVDVEDPDFEALIEAIRNDNTQSNFNLILTWYFFFSPNGPLHLLNP